VRNREPCPIGGDHQAGRLHLPAARQRTPRTRLHRSPTTLGESWPRSPPEAAQALALEINASGRAVLGTSKQAAWAPIRLNRHGTSRGHIDRKPQPLRRAGLGRGPKAGPNSDLIEGKSEPAGHQGPCTETPAPGHSRVKQGDRQATLCQHQSREAPEASANDHSTGSSPQDCQRHPHLQATPRERPHQWLATGRCGATLGSGAAGSVALSAPQLAAAIRKVIPSLAPLHIRSISLVKWAQNRDVNDTAFIVSAWPAADH